ncbi:MAG TPA: hypothetical protein PK467_16260 [Candidatus Wallbacteria bacterium]|nr:hypothetical protein [Candidatus Wallbacteria bacterium]
MGLASFSAILEFAIGEEKKAADFISSIIGNSNTPNSETLKKIQSESEKNKKNLQMILQENVTEMVMEPCEEIDEKAFALDPSILKNEKDLPGALERQAAFFKSASKSINLKEVKRSFDKMSERKISLIGEIKK